MRFRSFLNGPAHASQVVAETEGRRLFALCKVDVKLNLATQGNTSTDEFGLAPLGVADGLGKREDVPSACDGHKQPAIVIAEDQVLAAHRPISHDDGLQPIFGTDVESLRAGWDRSQPEDRRPLDATPISSRRRATNQAATMDSTRTHRRRPS